MTRPEPRGATASSSSGKDGPVGKSDWLSAADVADLLNVQLRTVNDWRYRGIGPHYYKFGGSVRYSNADVDAFIKANRADEGYR